MFHSAESRWFFEGPVPVAVRDWFAAGGAGEPEPARTDDYLLLPGCATTGVKLREGNLEIKAMTCTSEPVAYAGGVRGYQDGWVKWSCSAGDAEALRRTLGASGDRWAAVTKSRRLRLFSMDSGAPVELDDRSPRVTRGCQAELTGIGVSVGALGAARTDGDPSAAWWSLSLEAFAHDAPGAAATAIRILTAVANHLFDEPPPRALDAAHACAYPAWLLRFA